MKVIILKTNLKSGLDVVGRGVGTTTNLPVLGTVLFEARNNQIKLSTTNLELATTKIIFGKIIEEGEIAVSFSTLSGIVNNISSERINLEVKNTNLIIKTDNYEARIQGLDTKDFPIIPTIKDKKEHLEIQGDLLRDALQKTTMAAEVSDLRPEIGGVLLAVEPSGAKIVGTDSFRLAEAALSGNQIKNTFSAGFMITIPLKAAQELSRIVEDKENVQIYTDETQVLFQTESLSMVSRLVEGKFPDYKAIVPKDIESNVAVDREELIGGLKLASSFSGRNSEVTLRTKDKKTLEIFSSDSSVGENRFLLPIKADGPDTEVIFNWQFLLDGVKAGQSKTVVLGLNGEERPAVIKSPEESGYFYILMPIKP
ncbi:MAG: DNA polymerase III subunit beta [Candidatus Colwellbacteria bacterium]|nr:DNA polymerase III subunit beta [Candidatus Colwellbacteria bacterium]